MAEVRVAIVGAGVIGKRHVAAIAECENVELVGFADPFPGSQQVASQAKVPWFDNVGTLIEAIKPDGVVISTPTEAHFKPTMIALNAGVHVLVEKPIMATLEEAEQVVDLSEKTGLHVLAGHQRRYYSLMQKARDIVRGGNLGKLVTVSGLWNMRKNKSYYEPDWRKNWKSGPIMTNFIHEIDLLRYICGELVTISAETSNAVMGFEKEDAAAVIMKFENGALGTFLLSDQATSPWSWELATGENAALPKTGQNATRFMGTKAALDFPNLTLWHHGEATPDWNHAMVGEDISETIEDAYVAQMTHFAAVIHGTQSPRINARDATETLRATLAVFDAARSGKRIALNRGPA
jgi:predicted dehydrogenase